MSLETVSTKRNRTYLRAFDHDEARALHKVGWSYSKLAERYGVSASAIRRVCDPAARAKMDAHTREWIEGKREPCLSGCGRLVYSRAIRPNATGYCVECIGVVQSAPNVRETELRCHKCGQWKPDTEFANDSNRKNRRYKRNRCRVCDTAERTAYRRANQDRERAYQNRRKRQGKDTTMFVVLRKTDSGLWEERARLNAASRLHAIEKAADDEGVYAAVSEGQLNEMVVEQTLAFRVAKPSQNGHGPSTSA